MGNIINILFCCYKAFFIFGRSDAAKSNTHGSFNCRVRRLHRNWYGSSRTHTLRAIAWGLANHYWRYGIGLPYLQLHVPVPRWLASRSLGTQTGHDSQSLYPGNTLPGLLADYRP